MNDAVPDAPQRDYRDTVFLPQTSFPMRGDLPKKEPQILAKWDAMDLWGKLRAASAGRPLFILHDGPPYANVQTCNMIYRYIILACIAYIVNISFETNVNF